MDYHDYVIKDGVFIGKFDDMYKDCDNPWLQKDAVIQAHKMACMASINMAKPKKVLEIGCGLGYVTSFYSDVFPDISFTGMDISATAVEKAQETFPNIDYVCDNVAQIVDFSTYRGGYDALVFSEVIWYILDDLDNILKRLKNTFSGKYIFINQSFYPEGEQKYGREYFTTPKGLIEYFGMKTVNYVTSYSEGVNGYDVHIALKVD